MFSLLTIEISNNQIFSRYHKYQFVNNNPLFFTNHPRTGSKSVGYQIPNRRLGVNAMKIEFTAAEMF